MLNMTDTEMNEFCARELGWTRIYEEIVFGTGTRLLFGYPPKPNKEAAEMLPNFLNSESANALLLEAMPWPSVYLDGDNEKVWACTPDHAFYEGAFKAYRDPDRKRAIALAFIAWRQSGGK